MTEKIANSSLAEKIKDLFQNKDIDLLIGYRKKIIPMADGKVKILVSPFFCTDPELACELIWDTHCINNLSTYLTKNHVSKYKRIAIMVKPCDMRAINVLLQENQIKREKIFIIGLFCKGVTQNGVNENKMALKCITCDMRDNEPDIFHNADLIVTDQLGDNPVCTEDLIKTQLDNLDNMDQKSRWRLWQKEFEKCIRCYACSSICPVCYCERCVVEVSQPQWVNSSAHLKGNFIYHLIRAFHMSGRCIGCGECMRACPVGIPLMVLYKRMNQTINRLFNYVPGDDTNNEAVLSQFRLDDDNSFIK